MVINIINCIYFGPSLLHIVHVQVGINTYSYVGLELETNLKSTCHLYKLSLELCYRELL